MSQVIIEAFSDKKDKKVDGIVLKISEFFSNTLQGEGISIGVPATFLRLQNCTLNCSWCFHENTKIVLADGSPKKIKDIKEGEILLTLDEQHNIVETTVQNVLKRQTSTNDLIGLRFLQDLNESPIFTTKEHPFYVKNKGYTKAIDLRVGDIILGPTTKQINSYKSSRNNNQKNSIYLQKRKNTQLHLRRIGLIKPYIRTEEQNKRLSISRLGDKNPMKNPEVSRKNAESHYYKPSQLELSFVKLFEELQLDILFIGCKNKLAIGSKQERYRFPDFIVNNTKKLIETYDTTFEYEFEGIRKCRGEQWQNRTTEHYRKFDYEVLFLTELDLKDLEKLKEKLFNYIYNGSELLEVISELSIKQKARLFGNVKEEECEVFNLKCAPFNTYLLSSKYHHKLVHNCDTTEVWRQGNSYTIQEIFNLIEENNLVEKFRSGQHLILTGGSPLLQQVPLIYFIEQFITRFGFKPYIEVENECVKQPLDRLIELVDQWNNSPKLNNSGMKVLLRYKPEILTFMNSLRNSWFKFVIENEEDWKEVERDFLETKLINKEKVILMPCGDTQEKLNITRPIVADLACREGIRFSDRLHVTIWDKKTGV